MNQEERAEFMRMNTEFYMRGRLESLEDAAETVRLVGPPLYTKSEVIAMLERLAENTLGLSKEIRK